MSMGSDVDTVLIDMVAGLAWLPVGVVQWLLCTDPHPVALTDHVISSNPNVITRPLSWKKVS